MVHEKQVQEWLESGTITQEQAQKMIADVNQKSNEERSNKFIVAISTIGSILLGIGAILFIASNWQGIPDFMKILILLITTFSAYYLGYLFKYDKKNLPKVGASLFFLGALFFGASIFLVAQIYHINANGHSLVLIWLIGVLPLVYAFKSESIATLSALLGFLWIGLFISGFDRDGDIVLLFPIIYLSAGISLLSIGGLHYIKPQLAKIAGIFRIVGLKIAVFSLFLLTFELFSGRIDSYWFYSARAIENMTVQLVVVMIIFFMLAIIGLLIDLLYNFSRSKTNLFENVTALGILIFTILFFFFPAESSIYTIIYNLLFAVVTLFLIYIGYLRSNISIVNTGIFWLSVFIFTKYFDFFWELMDRSLFFIFGGLLLILGGIAMERKRRQIKENFRNLNT